MSLLWSVLIFGWMVWFPLVAHGGDDSLIARMQNVQKSLVEVKTVYARALRTKNGGKAIASYERHGTGIIVDPRGIIVTNTHIIRDAPRILVALSDGKVYEARPIYASEADFSFLKIDCPYPLQSVTWADSSQAQLGQPVVVLGNSDLNQQSILGGQITSLLESMTSKDIELLELDVSLHQGDSGGPVLDRDGRLLGLIMAKRKREDRQSYAIASNKIRWEYWKFKQNMP